MFERLCCALGCAMLATALLVPLDVHASEDVMQLEWDDLMPDSWDPFAQLKELMESNDGQLSDDSPEAEQAMQAYLSAGKSAPVVGELDGRIVRIPGFIVPLDFDGTEVSEFLLVPYFGACIHVPPPPANQIVYVSSADSHPVDEIYDPVWVTGRLSTQAHYNDVGNAGYTLQASGIETYSEKEQ